MNLYLCGFQGAGKTHHGKNLSSLLNKPFFDVDASILTLHPAPSIRALCNEIGESEFRKIEAGVIFELTRVQDCIISLGGGSLETESVRAPILRSGRLIYLYKPYDKVFPKTLPSYLKSLDDFPALFEKRHRTFACLAHLTIPIHAGTTSESLADRLKEVL